MRRAIFFVVLALFLSVSFFSYSQEQTTDDGRYVVKTVKLKSYYMNQQGELTRWADDELVRIDTRTGKVWKWVSERSLDRKELKEYWQQLEDNTVPMSDGAR
ncbi:MAG: hypothetical protein HQL28_06285 [Candidatus Omnitrophica bacterium]|nr:hypothetical protein [Candidatus Omnitrophota bacterium]